jgi:hypothetical protein
LGTDVHGGQQNECHQNSNAVAAHRIFGVKNGANWFYFGRVKYRDESINR